MCGICGIAYRDNCRIPDLKILQKMNSRMVNRGPDGEGIFRANGIGLAMRRLSIIDLVSGDQPLYNEKKSIALVCNGEIYNYVELRKLLEVKGHIFASQSDAEVIIHCYEEYGTECLQYLRGMFGFALWDSDKLQLFCARDRMGIKPFHYAVDRKGDICFASTAKSLLAAELVRPELDPYALKDVLTYGFVTGGRTYFKGIKSLLPAHYLLYSEGSLSVKQYWDVPFPGCSMGGGKRSEKEWAEILEEKFIETVRIHLRSDVPVCGWLSPGIDSSSIVKHMCDFSAQPIETFTMSFTDAAADEIRTKPLLSDYPGYDIPNQCLRFSSDHFSLFPETVWQEERPDITGVHTVQMLLSAETAKDYKVVLTGEGADELFGGYPWYRTDKIARSLAWIPNRLLENVLSGSFGASMNPMDYQAFFARRPITAQTYADLVSLQHQECCKTLWSDEIAQALMIPDEVSPVPCNNKWLASLHPFERIQYIEMKTRLGNWITHGLDTMSMSRSLEVRVPFLDHELVECAAKIPPSLKMKGLREKHIFRAAMTAHLPAEICQRRKFGLRAPNASWFMTEKLPDFAQEMFSSEYCRKAGYFSPNIVESLLRRHRSGKKSYAKPLLLLLGTHIWHEQFINGSGV